LNPVHQGGRGAGGHCFIKDFSAFRMIYEKNIKDKLGLDVIKSLEKKNIALLLDSNKNLDLLEGVYGKKAIKKSKK
jgi:UDP-glucose 6-dehydrogenase